jgi:hypothetical protein
MSSDLLNIRFLTNEKGEKIADIKALDNQEEALKHSRVFSEAYNTLDLLLETEKILFSIKQLDPKIFNSDIFLKIDEHKKKLKI